MISVNRTGTISEIAELNKRIYKVYANLNPTITATAGKGGSITSAGKKEVSYGENQKYDFTANEGYVIASLKIDGVEQTVEPATPDSYEFNAVKSPHTIEVSFAKAKDSVHMPKLKPQLKTPAPKREPEKRIGMLPKTGESASYAGLLAALGFSLADQGSSSTGIIIYGSFILIGIYSLKALR